MEPLTVYLESIDPYTRIHSVPEESLEKPLNLILGSGGVEERNCSYSTG